MPDSSPHSELRDWIEKNDPTSIGMYLVEFDRLVEKANLIDLRRQIDEKLLNQVGELSFPECVVVDENGAYWREFGDHYSMCPVSDDNEPVHPVAVYVPEWRLDAEKDERRSLEEQYETLHSAVFAFASEISEATFDDPRIEWVEVQVDREALAAFRALAGHNPARVSEAQVDSPSAQGVDRGDEPGEAQARKATVASDPPASETPAQSPASRPSDD